ncbi:MAG: hypothetical protein NTY36_09355 [Deltaproteobacteria bacterium]|nr:hypothetical protein [Deltaproteobacteria bacterium]
MNSKRFISVLFFGLVFFMSVSAQAVPVTGTLNLTGDVQIDATHFNWFPVAVGTGTFTVGSTSTGNFIALRGSSGVVLDLNLGVPIPPTLNNYLVFSANPDLRFDLNLIFPGATFGPLTLTDTATGVNLAWQVRTTAVRISTGERTRYTGTYSSQFIGISSAQLLAVLRSGGSISLTYSARFSPCPAIAPLLLLLLN